MKTLVNPTAEQIKGTPEAFLQSINDSIFIYVDGQDRSVTRGLVTLLHGNEPSGIHALHRWLKLGVQPLYNLICFIPSVPAALLEPMFKNRVYPEQRDMNRCFLPPFYDAPGQLAEDILEKISEYQPECILDIHNTSGHSPDFGVVTFENATHEALVSLFSQRLVVTDLRLGSLMETSTRRCPVVTIECGGVKDRSSGEIAWQGLLRYLNDQDVMSLKHGHIMDIYRHPVRLELKENTTLAYSRSYVLGTDLTVPDSLEHLNFDLADTGTLIGWLGGRSVDHYLVVNDASGQNVFERYFTVKGNQLLTAQPLKLFMITNRPDIALSDCLLYAAEEREHTVLET
jgi:hypothetical protein